MRLRAVVARRGCRAVEGSWMRWPVSKKHRELKLLLEDEDLAAVVNRILQRVVEGAIGIHALTPGGS